MEDHKKEIRKEALNDLNNVRSRYKDFKDFEQNYMVSSGSLLRNMSSRDIYDMINAFNHLKSIKEKQNRKSLSGIIN